MWSTVATSPRGRRRHRFDFPTFTLLCLVSVAIFSTSHHVLHAQMLPQGMAGPDFGMMPPPMMAGQGYVPQEMYDPYTPYAGPQAIVNSVLGLVGTIVNTAMQASNRNQSPNGYRSKRQASSYLLAGNISLGYGDPAQESGPWDEWAPLGDCSRACGGGVQFQTRVCKERNYDGSQACVGASKRYFSCNIEECPEGTKDFREDQCSRFDAVPFEGSYYNWIPYTQVPNPCELNCRPREYGDGRRFYYRQARKVLDGTPCHYNQTGRPLDVCIDGVCVELGCDRRLGSPLREDKCRVCGGNARSCRTVEGRYDERSGLMLNSYNDILLIPEGATNIVIKEVDPSRNYLAIRNADGVYYLNGDWKIQPPSASAFAGTTFYYERARKNEPNLPEKITAKGPTNEKLVVVMLMQEDNRGVDYEYSVPFRQHQAPASVGISPNNRTKDVEGRQQHYAWIFGDYGECSRTCGTGVQKRDVFCARIIEGGRQEPVGDTLCESSIRPANTRTCTQAPCPATWKKGEWGECSCVHRVQRRDVHCSSDEGQTTPEDSILVLPDDKCKLNGTLDKPVEMKECTPIADKCPRWIVGEWTQCSAGKCGLGTQSRSVRCGRQINKSASLSTGEARAAILDAKEEEAKPEVSIQKREAEEATTSSSGGEVSTEAASSIQEEFEYLDPVYCDSTLRPLDVKPCAQRVCDEEGGLEWIVSDWTPASCEDTDKGTITRHVLCSTRNGTIYPEHLCIQAGRGEKPSARKPCSTSVEVVQSSWFTSEWSECNATCGLAHRTRKVFCGRLEGSEAKVDEDVSKCTQAKPSEVAGCILPACSNITFIGPLGSCSLPCGGGQRNRSAMCFTQADDLPGLEISLKLISPAEECEGKSSRMKTREQCNIEACDDDEVAAVLECKDTQYGCCPNDISRAAEKNLENCPPMIANETNGIECAKSTWGCCPSLTLEGASVQALGPFALGCPTNCNNTLHGCCPDNVTMIVAGRMNDCPAVPCREDDIECNPPTTTASPTTIPPTLPPLSLSPVSSSLSALTASEDNLEGSGDESPAGGLKVNSGENDIEGSGDEEQPTEPVKSGVLTTIKSIIDSIATTIVPPTTRDESNCTLTEFGCCPTGKKAASGLNYVGCSCEDYPFGCCQDRYTPATGPDYEGCECAHMLYGCCSDKKTPATGPSNDGCTCHTTAHGCCPDMVAIAQGPNFYGCPCETLKYGCCPNSQMPAQGPNFDKCTCIESPHGCCSDGKSVALGPNFEGCPSGPPLDLKLQSEVCGLSKEVGPCRNFSVKWFFDSSYGDCNRFWYGGCEGNANRFSSQELCQRACVKPEGPERCSLPVISGPCNASETAYYFDSTHRRCEVFTYGGCLGNTNRFPTLEACQLACLYEEKARDVCEQAVSAGPCRGQYRRWYYRREEGRCREFSYGGCQGNANNFQTEESCRSTCASKTPFEICSLPKATGPCLGNFPRWHFDLSTGVCREFTYTGCQGNRNRFVDRESCERMCNQTIPYYNRGVATGIDGPYPSSAANEIVDPNRSSGARPADTYQSVCILPKAQGSCRALITQWYFNPANRRCELFYYGGCEGNANRFDDRETCEAMCLVPYSGGASYPQDPCLEPKDPGPCQNPSIRYYYNIEDRRCHRFYYSGCGGSRNQFTSENECISRCEARIGSSLAASTSLATTEPSSVAISKFNVDFCYRPLEVGSCNKNILKWYYDKRDGVCKEFYYGGCGGNENRFESQAHCVQMCYNSQDICRLPKVRGPCKKNFTQWHYNVDTNECQEFEFSGCEGNANRFSSHVECEMHCKSGAAGGARPSTNVVSSYPVGYVYTTDGERPMPPQCQLSREPGPCYGYFKKWYYLPSENQCQIFVYGGCEGNANRFDERDECEATCIHRHADDDDDRVQEEPKDAKTKEIICRLPYDQGRCHDTQARWYYDSGSHSCFPFAYGGCEGNLNRFRSYEKCIKFCKGVMSFEQAGVSLPQPEYPFTALELPQPSPPPPPAPSQPGNVVCQPVECGKENCVLGIDRFNDNRGCPTCRCTNPCNDQQCPNGMQCSVELFRDPSGQPQGRAECRLLNKPGLCPRDVIKYSNIENAANVPYCVDQCRTDADCRGVDKCCNNGCANVCFEPEAGSFDPRTVVSVTLPGSTTYNSTEGQRARPIQPAEQDVYRTDQDQSGSRAWNEEDPVDEDDDHEELGITKISSGQNQSSENYVTVLEGQDVSLACPIEVDTDSSGNLTATTVTWSKDGRAIGEVQRFGLFSNGSLGIRGVAAQDAGTFACSRPVAIKNGSQNIGYTMETRYVQLVVNYQVRMDPSRGVAKVIGRLGGSVKLRCSVQANPKPNITWTREGKEAIKLDETMHESTSVPKYKLSRLNQTLTVRALGAEDQGLYTCLAFNGIGKAVSVQIQLLLDARATEPEIVPFNPALFNQPDSLAGQRGGQPTPNWIQQPKPTSLDRIRASILATPRDYRVGSMLQLDCVVQSQITGKPMVPPEVNILWYAKSSDIPLVIDASNQHHYRLLANQTLQVYNLAKTDSGEYRCRANSKPTVESVASVQIQVDDFHVPEDCHDSPFFRQCAHIVKAQFCSNEQYRKFCCRSCFLAEMSSRY